MTTDDLINQRLGQYEIKSLLGRGGMATVYLARQTSMNRDVAIKVMAKELADDEQFVTRFEHEAQLIAKLQHPHILPVIDFGRQDKHIYIVMRLVKGGSLDDRLRGGPLTLNLASRMLEQIGSALTFAHEQGIIHRDLKPNNVLLDEKDNAYLTDFGIAKMLAGTSKLTATGNILGTPAYMAPEQWRGEAVDARTDIYSLGVMLYEMVLGRLPFAGETPYTLMYKHFNDPPPPPRMLNPNLNPAIEAVILRALSKNADDRYQSADAMAEDFGNAVRGLPPAVRQAPASPMLDQTVVGEDAALRTPSPHSMEEMATLGPTGGTPPRMPTPPGPAVPSSTAPTPTPAPVPATSLTPAAPTKRGGISPVVIGAVALLVIGLLAGGAYMLFGQGGGGDETPTPGGTQAALLTTTEPTEEPTETPSATPTEEPTATPTSPPTSTPTDEPSPTPTERFTMAVVLTERSTVRSGPGSEFAALGTLGRNEQVMVTGISENGEWVQIPFQGIGWVWIETVQITGNPNIPVIPWPTVTPVPTSTPEPTATHTPEPTSTHTPEPTNTSSPPSPTPPEQLSDIDPALFVPESFAPISLDNINVALDFPANWPDPSRIGSLYYLTAVQTGDPASDFYPTIAVARGEPEALQNQGLTTDVSSPVNAIEHTFEANFTGMSQAVNTFNYPAYAINQRDPDLHAWIWLIELSTTDWLYIIALAPTGDYDLPFERQVLNRMVASLQVDGEMVAVGSSVFNVDDANILTDIPIQRGEPIVDRYDNNANDWRFATIRDGRLILAIPELDFLGWSFPAIIENAAPAFYYQVTGELVDPKPNYWEFGMAFRVVDGNNFYYFAINNNNQYLVLSAENGIYQEVLGPNYSDSISTDANARNTLGVLVIGDYVELYLNNQRVNSFIRSAHKSGSVHVAAYSYTNSDRPPTVAFDDFVYIPLNVAANNPLNNDLLATVATPIADVSITVLPQPGSEALITIPAGSPIVAFGRTPDNQYLFVYGLGNIGWIESAAANLSRDGSATTIDTLPAVAPSLSGLKVQVWPVIWQDSSTTPDNIEPTPTPAPSVEVTLAYGQQVTATLDQSGASSATWTFFGMAGDVVTISVQAASDSANLDTSLTILDSTGATLYFDDDGGPGVNPLIEDYQIPADGVYTVQVNSLSGTGTFTLSLDQVQ